MISLFVKEQKRYTQANLAKLFQSNLEKTAEYIKKLKQYGVLKAVKSNSSQLDMSVLAEEDIEIEDTEVGQTNYFYVFTFVGVITAFGRVLKCYPKYIFSEEKTTAQLRTILRVLEKYNSKEQVIKMFNDSENSSSFNLLAVILYLLQDYYENGLYTNTLDVVETNGSGEILWDKTINETFAYLSNNRPYYVEMYTQKRVNNDFDYLKRLHECILCISSRELKEAGLLDLFGIMPVEISDEILDDFGEIDEILYHIENEISIQFNTRKLLVLKTLYTYVAQSKHISDIDNFSMFGTNTFNLVWEKVCSEVMDNRLQMQIKDLPFSTSNIDRSLKLIDLVENPKWYGKNDAFFQEAKDTLVPDIVTLHKFSDKYRFIIFDAKYYNLTLEAEKLSGQPGIGDVTKQYLYQLAYKNVTEDEDIEDVRNCFLMPTENDDVVDKGRVSLDMLDGLCLESIQIRQLPSEEIYSHYLRNEKFDITRLSL